MRLFQNANYPFVEKRYIFFVISAVLIVASILGIIIKGINWSTDFTGGVSIVINMQPKDKQVPPLEIEHLREVINDAGFKCHFLFVFYIVFIFLSFLAFVLSSSQYHVEHRQNF